MRHPDPRPRTPSPGSEPAASEPSVGERALGALTGLALGDALGMPTQSMSPAQIRRCYGEITGLRDAVAEQPIAPSMPAGSVTDDTEQALILAGLLTDGDGRIDTILVDQDHDGYADGVFTDADGDGMIDDFSAAHSDDIAPMIDDFGVEADDLHQVGHDDMHDGGDTIGV